MIKLKLGFVQVRLSYFLQHFNWNFNRKLIKFDLKPQKTFIIAANRSQFCVTVLPTLK